MTCHAPDLPTQRIWLQHAQAAVLQLSTEHALRLVCLIIPLDDPYDAGHAFTTQLQLPSHWRIRSGTMHSSMYGDCVAAYRWVALCYRHQDLEFLAAPRFPSPPLDTIGPPLATCLEKNYDNLLNSVCHIPPHSNCYPFTHHIPTIIARSPGSTTSIAHMIVHPNSAAPVPHSTDGPFQYTYGVPFAGHDHSTHIRAARLIEILHTYSTPPATINIVKTSEPTTQDTVQQVLCTSSPFKFAASLVEQWMKDFILPSYYEPMDIINS
ncbi:MAG: hypothetical protein ACREOZ_04425, partial [Gloeomargaritales cyanobacterium]